MTQKTSRISGFHKLSVSERIDQALAFAGLADSDLKALFLDTGNLPT